MFLYTFCRFDGCDALQTLLINKTFRFAGEWCRLYACICVRHRNLFEAEGNTKSFPMKNSDFVTVNEILFLNQFFAHSTSSNICYQKLCAYRMFQWFRWMGKCCKPPLDLSPYIDVGSMLIQVGKQKSCKNSLPQRYETALHVQLKNSSFCYDIDLNFTWSFMCWHFLFPQEFI